METLFNNSGLKVSQILSKIYLCDSHEVICTIWPGLAWPSNYRLVDLTCIGAVEVKLTTKS